MITPEIQEAFCLAIADNMTVRQACAQDGMPAERTIYMALASDTGFAQRYARAREAQLIRWEDEIREIADDGSNDWQETEKGPLVDHEHIARSKVRIDARKWLMAKRLPQKYGDRTIHEGGDKPIKTEDVSPQRSNRDLAKALLSVISDATRETGA